MDFVRSNRDHEKIIYNGFEYVLQKKCNMWIRWRCAKFTTKGVSTLFYSNEGQGGGAH